MCLTKSIIKQVHEWSHRETHNQVTQYFLPSPHVSARQCMCTHSGRTYHQSRRLQSRVQCAGWLKNYFALRGACLLLGASTQLQYTLVSTTVAAATQSYCDVTMIDASCLTPCEKDCETTFVNFGAVSLFSCVSSDELHSTCFTKTNNTHFFVH